MPYFNINHPLLHFYLSQFQRLPPPLKSKPCNPVQGKVIVITGANSGIGLSAAHELAGLKPSHLILAVRTLSNGADAVQSILKVNPSLKVDVWELDMSKFASVKAFAERANKELDHLDIAFLNAGVNPGLKQIPFPVTEDGHEVVAQVNGLATVMLGVLLEPVLSKSADPKLIITSSEVHAWADSSFIAKAVKSGKSIIETYDDPDQYHTPTRYWESKLLLQLLVRPLIAALPQIKIISVNPGLCASNLGRSIEPSLSMIGLALWFIFWRRPAEHGARAILSATEAEESSEYWHMNQAAFAPATFMATPTGHKASEKVFKEFKAEMERVAPGSTSCLQ